ncbi:MAG: hypothetical protein VX938_08735, partial [Myxococcota bacterium]|nr:hypothetical protein [Myxococcota bacterium]
MDDDAAGGAIGEPRPGGRTRILGFITAFICLQLVIPVTYYAGDDPADERFSWRMFSMRRAERCQVSVKEHVQSQGQVTQRDLKLSSVIHEGWKSALSRRRTDVIHAFFRWRCSEPDVTQVGLIRRCRDATGNPKEPDRILHRCALPGD